MAPSCPSEPPSNFKSRFSLLSLLPSRHPPLQVSQPRPLLASDLPIRSVPRYDAHLLPDSTPQRVVSQYASPLTSYPDTPLITSSYGMSTPPKGRRPPPIDLTRIRAAYPTEQAINGAREVDFGTPSTPSPISPYARERRPVSPPILAPLPPVPALKKARSKRKKPMAVEDDPFDIAIVEPGHRYDSWTGGKVDIRPGQVIPRGLVGSYTGKRGTIRGEAPEEEGEVYDSVLQHVLLTPTYLRASPSSTHHSIPARSKRETMLEKAKRMSRFVPTLPSAMKREDPSARAVRDMRDREGAEMDRFRRMQGLQLGSSSSVGLGSPVGKGQTSPGMLGEREAKVGAGPREYERYDIKELRDVKGGALRRYESRERRRNCWGWGTRKRSQEEMKSMSMSRRLFIKFRCLAFFLLLLIAAIVIAAVFLTRPASTSSSTASSDNSTSTFSAPSASSVSGSSTPRPSQVSGSASVSASATSPPAPTSTSKTLQICLDLYTSSSTSPYPCSDCTPLLLGTVNDYTTPLVNGNSTGVGAALQYCTMMDVLAAGSKSGFEGIGWTGRGTCTWSGVKCDARGRVTELSLNYPNVPYQFPTTIGQIPTLTTLRIKGNSSVPAGPFPSSLITPTLVTLDISDTALQGPIATYDFGRASALTTVYLANNPILGSGIPDLRNNGRLLTLAMTGQLLNSVTEANLPSSLTYLDLSFNALFGQVPSFTSLAGVKTLYLESNQYTNAPSSLPSGLTDLKMNNNPSLRGGMPGASCNATALASCDLRNTGLGGSMSSTDGARTCGRCLY